MAATRRMTHAYDGTLVVFMIGMKIIKPWRPNLWFPVFQAMPKMLRELASDPDSGLLGYRLVMDPRGPWIVQYWRSVGQLYAYATDPDAQHRPAWTHYNAMIKKGDGAVGVWHETYSVDRAESIYVDMPVEGLAKFTAAVPVTQRLDRARDRIDR